MEVEPCLLAWESISIRSTFLPLRAIAAEMEMLEEVLPTPPFCDAIENFINKLNLTKTQWVISIAFLRTRTRINYA